jgi:hypothetical protein
VEQFYPHFFSAAYPALPQQEESGVYARVILQNAIYVLHFVIELREVALCRGVSFFFLVRSSPITSTAILCLRGHDDDEPNESGPESKKKKKTPLPTSPARGTFGVT